MRIHSAPICAALGLEEECSRIRKPSSGVSPGAVTLTRAFANAAGKSAAARLSADRMTGSRMVSAHTSANSFSLEPK